MTELAMLKVARAERLKRILIVATTLLVLVCLALLINLLGQVRNTQLDGTPLGKQLLESSDRILDCTEAGNDTTPPGNCYERNRESTAQILSSAQRIILLSAACAVDLDPSQPVDERVQSITECVTRRLAASQP